MLLDLTDRAMEQAELFAGSAPRRGRLMAAPDAGTDAVGVGPSASGTASTTRPDT